MTILLKWLAIIVAIVLVTIFAVRAWDSQRGAPLALWQTYVPHELTAKELGTANWGDYLRAEDALINEVRTAVSEKLAPADCTMSNRYCPKSPIYPPNFKQNWNRSYILEPAGTPVGVVVLLHGLTDSPYSVRSVAQAYQARGWLALAIRLPGHGTVPAGLTRVTTDQWRAATALAVREARRRVPSGPLDIVGYSNGGALALDHALSAITDKSLPQTSRIVLMSPQVGITGAARFAGVAGWPAVFPAFAKAAWLDLLPEYNPFKYNSFPINAARQSFAMTQLVQSAIDDRVADGSIKQMPPVLTFQSVVDATVDMRATVTALYNKLPANGSALVLIDMNRDAVFASLLTPGAAPDLDRLLAPVPRTYAVSLLTNQGHAASVEVRDTPAGSTEATIVPLEQGWPPEVYSVGHIAIPFALDDPLYGIVRNPTESFGIQLGALAVRGERGVLVVPPSLLMRISANPFHAYMLERIVAGMGTPPG